MLIKIQKWGNSLALRIPKAFAFQSNIREYEFVNLSLEENKIIIEPIEEKKYLLKDLLLGINESNIQNEIDFGQPEGNEHW